MNLKDLGPRICVMGPSNSGKSTLSVALGRRLNAPVVHLDQWYHKPSTDWASRPFAEFKKLHDEAILTERWIIEGNYVRLLPERLAHATGVILLEISTLRSLYRYFRRSLFQQNERIGGLTGGRENIKWSMIRHIIVTDRISRANRRRLTEGSGLPVIALESAQEARRFHVCEGLSLP